MYNVLILGGYGNFGKRISISLAKVGGIRVIVAGRDIGKAMDLADRLNKGNNAGHVGYEIDINSPDFRNRLIESQAQLVIHTSGPFQNQPYRVAEACIYASIKYIDLADDRTFVCGITTLNQRAKEQGVLVVSGASSVPGLSSAVVNQFIGEFSELTGISHGFSPGNKTNRGEATVKSILSYIGRPFSILKDGRPKTVYGWQGIHRRKFPAPVGSRWVSNCEIPDLELFPKYYPTVKTVEFHAGLELSIMHVGLWCLSWLARARIVSNWARYASEITKMSRWFERLGTENGGMYVHMSGKGLGGRPLSIQWYLVAGSNHGPEIPTIASIIITKKLARGELSTTGAVACLGLFSLDEFMQAVKGLDISQVVDRS